MQEERVLIVEKVLITLSPSDTRYVLSRDTIRHHLFRSTLLLFFFYEQLPQ